MIEKSLVYIYGTRPVSRFVGCGTLVEGGFVATCRHVLRLAIGEGRPPEGELALEIEYPHAIRENTAFRTGALLADGCESGPGPSPDLVLLLPKAIPAETMILQLAREDKFESGVGFAIIGLAGRDMTNPHVPTDTRIEGKLADYRNAQGLRQFTGIIDAGYWSGRGSSGSPVFLEHGQQLAGLLRRSELGVNEGGSSLREAFILPATTIRPYLVELSARDAAESQHINVAQLQPILELIGAADISIAEIPNRIREFIKTTRAHAAEPVSMSNGGADIEAVIEVSRQKLGKLDPAGALVVLQAKIGEEGESRARRLVPLLQERATIERLAFNHEGAKATLLEIVQLSPDNIGAHIELGDIWRATGNLENAIKVYRAAERAAVRTGEQRGLYFSHNRIGGVLVSQGDRSSALAAYRAGLTIAEENVGRNPKDVQWQRELAASHIRIGDVLVSQGDRDGASKAYRTSLAISKTLVQNNPTNAEWKRDLSICHDRLGNLSLSQGDWDEALTAYDAALAVRKNLTVENPSNLQWQRDLSVSHSKIGDVLEAQRNFDGALAAYRAGLAIRRTLVDRDPVNTQWQRDLSLSHNRVGDVLKLQSKHEAALSAHRASLAIAEGLVQRDPGNFLWQRDVSVTHGKIGDVLESEGTHDAALSAYRASLAIAETLVTRDSANTEWARDVSVTQSKIGDVLELQGNREAALSAYRAGLAIAEMLVARDTVNVDWQRDLLFLLRKFAEIEPADALSHRSRALQIARSLQSVGKLAAEDAWVMDDLVQGSAG